MDKRSVASSMSPIRHALRPALPALVFFTSLFTGCDGSTLGRDAEMRSEVGRLRQRLERLEGDIRRQSEKIDDLGRQLEKSAMEVARIRKREQEAAKAEEARADTDLAAKTDAEGEAEANQDEGDEAKSSRIAFDDFTKKVQKALKRAGYDPGPQDGKKGPNTTRAIQAFQRENNVAQTGMADEATWALLKRYLE